MKISDLKANIERLKAEKQSLLTERAVMESKKESILKELSEKYDIHSIEELQSVIVSTDANIKEIAKKVSEFIDKVRSST